MPVRFSIAVQERGKATNSVRDIRASGYSEVIETSNQFTVGCTSHPRNNVRRHRLVVVGVCELEASGCRCVAGVRVGLPEFFEDAIDEGGLGDGDGPGSPVPSNGDAESELCRTKVGDLPA